MSFKKILNTIRLLKEVLDLFNFSEEEQEILITACHDLNRVLKETQHV